MSSYLLGNKAELYVNASPDTAAASVTDEVDQAGDVTINESRTGSQTIASRAGGGYAQKAPGLKEKSISLSLVKKPTNNAAFDIMKTAYDDDTEITVLYFDQPRATVGATGARFNATVASFTENQPVEGAITIDVELELTTFLSREETEA